MENNISEKDILTLLASNEQKEAIKQLLAYLETFNLSKYRDSFIREEIGKLVLISGRYKEIDDQLTMGVIDHQSANLQRNKINFSLIEFINNLPAFFWNEEELLGVLNEEAKQKPANTNKHTDDNKATDTFADAAVEVDQSAALVHQASSVQSQDAAVPQQTEARKAMKNEAIQEAPTKTEDIRPLVIPANWVAQILLTVIALLGLTSDIENYTLIAGLLLINCLIGLIGIFVQKSNLTKLIRTLVLQLVIQLFLAVFFLDLIGEAATLIFTLIYAVPYLVLAIWTSRTRSRQKTT